MITFPYALSTLTAHRILRVGAVPVLEVTVSYPCLEILEGEESDGAVRFNRAYADMAEAFLGWALDAPARGASEAFLALGAQAPYSFDRRLITCVMTAQLPPVKEGGAAGDLRVTRTVTASSRRGEIPLRELTALDLWRLPELTLRPSPRGKSRGSDPLKSRPKNRPKTLENS